MVFYYFKNDGSGPTGENNSGIEVSVDELAKLGVIYGHMDLDEVDKVAVKRNYKNRDTVSISTETPNLDSLLSKFFEEHMHEDEEIRYVTNGEGYFDVRDNDNRWIRCRVGPKDLLILPANIWHRFTLTSTKSIKAVRLFQDEPKWVAIPRV
ncbi:acireductone dioxygenase (Ni2+-requiring) [Martiniozyma asiatica (nom. inval.)]|nr:acireductone dioxygenase (Ni2+-requiring) [Martiniozyma asiatica]